MSSFTDDDLTRLKVSSNPMDFVYAFPAIIARLEAAEATIFMDGSTHYDDLIDAWRKAAGK